MIKVNIFNTIIGDAQIELRLNETNHTHKHKIIKGDSELLNLDKLNPAWLSPPPAISFCGLIHSQSTSIIIQTVI